MAAPGPRLSRRVNDKLWFSERVTEVLGRQPFPKPTVFTVRKPWPAGSLCWSEATSASASRCPTAPAVPATSSSKQDG